MVEFLQKVTVSKKVVVFHLVCVTVLVTGCWVFVVVVVVVVGFWVFVVVVVVVM